jgi:CRISPR-associated endonuclease/helicase Cas3
VNAIAHSANTAGVRQSLVEHLTRVAELSGAFAAAWGGGELAAVAGWLHDIGKFNPEFQNYLRAAETRPGARKRGPDHKGAGAVLASELGLGLLSILIQGHHGGLPSVTDVKKTLPERASDPAVRHAIEAARTALTSLESAARQASATLPQLALPTEAELFLRIQFSALVDADFLDTERHFAAGTTTHRDGAPDLAALWEQLAASQAALSGQHDDPVNRVRHEVYAQCLEAAALPPGFFRLTVPTGGGKTRSSLAFALRHALRHGLQRVIYAIPYTSIIEQTADVFRTIFPDPRAVLEHHSALAAVDDPINPTPDELWARLAAENWDAPLIVTTTVQLFESLAGRSTSACRKLHNIARSVIILDEAQMLPTHVLAPTLDLLRQLVGRYGATVLLCTATQPALDESRTFAGLSGIREIVPNPAELFSRLKRVAYQLPRPGERWTWDQVATEMAAERQALAIVNTRADAVAVLTALREHDLDGVYHLSTWMCGAHRRTTLHAVRQRLATGKPCYLVSTQVIEAGVDVDFPLVLRALAPLDRIVQAAGRCNRNGHLPAGGRVVVFVPEEGHVPPGPYRTGTDETWQLLDRSTALDLHDPAVYQRYFATYYTRIDPDERQVQAARSCLDYPEVARRFRLIEDDTLPMVVDYPPAPAGSTSSVSQLVERLRMDHANTRHLLRQLQPHIVGLRERELRLAQQRGMAEEIIAGLWWWRGSYDQLRGIVLDSGLDAGSLVW